MDGANGVRSGEIEWGGEEEVTEGGITGRPPVAARKGEVGGDTDGETEGEVDGETEEEEKEEFVEAESWSGVRVEPDVEPTVECFPMQ